MSKPQKIKLCGHMGHLCLNLYHTWLQVVCPGILLRWTKPTSLTTKHLWWKNWA